MNPRYILASIVLALLFTFPASADMTLSTRSSTTGCPSFFACNFSDAEVGALDFGVLYDTLPVNEQALNVGPSFDWQVEIDNTDGIHVDAQGTPGATWIVLTDVTFTVDQADSYSISGSLDATGTTGALLDLHLFDVTNNATVFRAVQESTGSTIGLTSTGGGNVTDSIIGNNFGQLTPGVEYKYTVECSGAASSSINCTTTNPVPEPGLASGFAAGFVLLAALARRKMK